MENNSHYKELKTIGLSWKPHRWKQNVCWNDWHIKPTIPWLVTPDSLHNLRCILTWLGSNIQDSLRYICSSKVLHLRMPMQHATCRHLLIQSSLQTIQLRSSSCYVDPHPGSQTRKMIWLFSSLMDDCEVGQGICLRGAKTGTWTIYHIWWQPSEKSANVLRIMRDRPRRTVSSHWCVTLVSSWAKNTCIVAFEAGLQEASTLASL